MKTSHSLVVVAYISVVWVFFGAAAAQIGKPEGTSPSRVGREEQSIGLGLSLREGKNCEWTCLEGENQEENSQEQAEADIQRINDERIKEGRKAGKAWATAPQYIAKGACYDLAWWAAHKKCGKGTCWNLRHGFCERC